MNIRILIFRSLLVTILSSLFFGCAKYYKHSANDVKMEKNVENSLPSDWRIMDAHNHIVVHIGNDMYEIHDVQYNEANDSIRARFTAFEGLPLKSYHKVLENRSQTAGRDKDMKKEDIRQVHLFINSFERISETELSFSKNDIFQVDVSKKAVFLNALASTGVVVGSAVVGLGALLAISCNCPHVYIDNGHGLEFNNTLFTGAKAPQLERFDYKEIPDYFPSSDQFSMKIVNEEKEDQYTNLVELITIMHDNDLEVIFDKNGRYHTIRDLILPTSAVDHDNLSVMRYLEERDDYPYRFDPASSEDLAEVTMKFDAGSQTNDAKLVIRTRNTQWSGYVYNEFNKLFGKNHEKWVEMNQDKPREEREKWMREQGIKMLVDIKKNGEWITIDEVEVIGEAAMNHVVIPIDRNMFGEELEVRFRSGYMFWELDYVGVDFSMNEAVTIEIHRPSKATGNNGEDFTQQLSYDDNVYMKHELETEVNTTDVLFNELPVDGSLKRTFILKSKGYYLPKSDYTGKTDRKRLQAFVNPGELSRFSRQLYEEVMRVMVTK